MKKNLSKVLALLLVLVMVLSNAATVFGADIRTLRGFGTVTEKGEKGGEIDQLKPGDAAVMPVEKPVTDEPEEKPLDPEVNPDPEPGVPAMPDDPIVPLIPDLNLPEQSFDGVVDGVSVHVDAPEGAFLPDTVMNLTSVSLESVQALIDASEFEGQTAVLAVDISFADVNGEELQPNIPVNVSISSDKLAEISAPVILHIGDDNEISEVVQPIEDEEPENPVPVNGIKNSETTLNFVASSFSTYTVTWNSGSATVHYGYMNGSSFVEFPNGTPSYTPTFNGNYAFLIYDVEGYDYDSTHLNSATGTAIQPILNVQGNTHQYTTGSTNWQGNLQWSNFGNNSNIYVVYKARPENTTGGTPEIEHDEDWPEDTPVFSKSSRSNGNSTNTISLSITAGEKPIEANTPADVIVVFDISRSMITNNLDGQTRLARAKTAVTNMANTLMGNNPEVRMALISFSTDAQVVRNLTYSLSDFRSSVNGLEGDGGTNWEKSLLLANQMEVRSDAATFVVFVTDGDPTFRVSRGAVSDSNLDMYNGTTYQYYRNNFVFGAGDSDANGRNFDFAVDQVAAINGANKSFYAIGISNDVTKVRNLTTEGGVDASHAFVAADNAAMEAAFKSITESIKSALGFGDVQMTDGITALTNTEMKVLQTVDTKSFKYYRYGGENNKYGADEAHKTEWTTREADGCAAATYNTEKGAVEWNMGEGFQLEAGVTYIVTFDVWPSQEAYDLVADLNNGIKSYDSLSDFEKSQVVVVPNTNPVQYALKTNTDEVNATYKKTTKSGETVTISDEHPIDARYEEGTIENIGLTAQSVTIKKTWNNKVDDHGAVPKLDDEGNPIYIGDEQVYYIILHLIKDGDVDHPYLDPELNTINNWQLDEFISCGLITTNEDKSVVTIREIGHDYTIVEPSDIDFGYYWNLTTFIYRPMVINGVLNVLIKEEEVDTASWDKTALYHAENDSEWYYIKDNWYKVNTNTTNLFEAINDRRSSLDLKKVVHGMAAAGELFRFDVTSTFPDNAKDSALWFSVQNSDGETQYGLATDALPEIKGLAGLEDDAGEVSYTYNSEDNTYTYTYNGETYTVPAADNGVGGEYYTGYYYKNLSNKTATLYLSLEDGWNARFTNFPAGASFTFVEEAKSIYEVESITGKFDPADGSAYDITTGDKKEMTVTLADRKIEGELNESNGVYYIEYTNKPLYFFIYHSKDNTIERIDIDDARIVNGKFNIVNEVKSESLYGGYYKAYSGAVLTDEQIHDYDYNTKATARENVTAYNGTHAAGTTKWIDDEEGKIPYSGNGDSSWAAADAYTESGLSFAIEPGAIYYLKEVPEYYLLPYSHYTYTQYDDNRITGLLFLSAFDDTNYQQTGFTVNGTYVQSTKNAKSLKVTTTTNGVSVTLKPESIYAAYGLQKGYLSYYNAVDYKVAGNTTVLQNWVTLDSVKVSGVGQRTVTGATSADTFETSDDKTVASTAVAFN